MTIELRRNLAVVAAILPAMILAACQTDGSGPTTMSLEQARNLAIELSGDAPSAPPRAPSDLDDMPQNLDELGKTPSHIEVLLSSDEDMKEIEKIYRGLPDEWGWSGWRFRNNARNQFERGAVTEAIKSITLRVRSRDDILVWVSTISAICLPTGTTGLRAVIGS